MDTFDAISPIDYRYYEGDKETFEKLQPYLSETAAIRYQLAVEVALVKSLAERKICDKKAAAEIEAAAKKVTAAEVYEEEKKIKHNIRALVNCIRNKVSTEAKPYVHFTATSNDIISTAEGLRLKDATINALLPQLLQLEKTLIGIARREKNTLQIGRTHGQHAEPITFGFTIASYVSRLGGRISTIATAANNMKGKFAGAVGAYNASSLLLKDPEEFEIAVLKKLGLQPSTHSTQIVEPEFAADLMHSVISAFGVMANIADDMRHLQRTEIGEVAEQFGAEQVGSSTMPHKRNPINFENVKSLWKEFVPRMTTVYADQISEHQRDLTNSASSRFMPEIIAAAFIAAKRLTAAMEKLVVVKENLNKNFNASKGMIAAEPAYILLAAAGHPDAHEYVRKLTLIAQQQRKSFQEVLMNDAVAQPYLKKMTKSQLQLLQNPERYTGIAAVKTEKVCRQWEKELRIR
ncbi:adenylosuccinate lyase [Candidatus Woesearchaeota archaeon]|nr:adenylosuccinate lyase [Candidatus Woesearchaeota archaeon]